MPYLRLFKIYVIIKHWQVSFYGKVMFLRNITHIENAQIKHKMSI
jgi:hypothetical protein